MVGALDDGILSRSISEQALLVRHGIGTSTLIQKQKILDFHPIQAWHASTATLEMGPKSNRLDVGVA